MSKEIKVGKDSWDSIDLTEFFKKLVVRGCFRGVESKSGRNYDIAVQTFAEEFGLDYESELENSLNHKIQSHVKFINMVKEKNEINDNKDLIEQLEESVDNLRDICLEDYEYEEESPYYHLLEQAIQELNNHLYPQVKK